MHTAKRVIAIHLPQFHPFKENDEWWGKGFTEWTNVTKSRPRYEGHYQPHLPSDTGFYDLRLPEARQLQADLAKEYGIYGFCYYHYWFNGKQLMERPVNEILASGEPDFPFMLCWANENWARNWDGGFKDVLMQQNYSTEDDVEHMRWLCTNVFPDKRYIRIDGKPVFAVYRVSLFPDFRKTVETWRKVAKEEFGMDIYIIETMFPGDLMHTSLTEGADAAMDFQPLGVEVSGLRQESVTLYGNPSEEDKPAVYNYSDYVDYRCDAEWMDRCFPCVSPGFDNASRRVNKRFLSFTQCTPQNYGRWLRDALYRDTSFEQDEENLVFVNAWNEWAEGNHIEPDQKWGRAYLEETKKSIDEYKEFGCPKDYETLRHKAFLEYKKKHPEVSNKPTPHTIYSQLKNVIKSSSITYDEAKRRIEEHRDVLPKSLLLKLKYKLFFYKVIKNR